MRSRSDGANNAWACRSTTPEDRNCNTLQTNEAAARRALAETQAVVASGEHCLSTRMRGQTDAGADFVGSQHFCIETLAEWQYDVGGNHLQKMEDAADAGAALQQCQVYLWVLQASHLATKRDGLAEF